MESFYVIVFIYTFAFTCKCSGATQCKRDDITVVQGCQYSEKTDKDIYVNFKGTVQQQCMCTIYGNRAGQLFIVFDEENSICGSALVSNGSYSQEIKCNKTTTFRITENQKINLTLLNSLEADICLRLVLHINKKSLHVKCGEVKEQTKTVTAIKSEGSYVTGDLNLNGHVRETAWKSESHFMRGFTSLRGPLKAAAPSALVSIGRRAVVSEHDLVTIPNTKSNTVTAIKSEGSNEILMIVTSVVIGVSVAAGCIIMIILARIGRRCQRKSTASQPLQIDQDSINGHMSNNPNSASQPLQSGQDTTSVYMPNNLYSSSQPLQTDHDNATTSSQMSNTPNSLANINDLQVDCGYEVVEVSIIQQNSAQRYVNKLHNPSTGSSVYSNCALLQENAYSEVNDDD